MDKLRKTSTKSNNRISDRDEHYRNLRQGLGLDNRDRNAQRPFAMNQIVRHIGTGIKLTVIGYGREQVLCRKPDLGTDYFFVHELEAVDSSESK